MTTPRTILGALVALTLGGCFAPKQLDDDTGLTSVATVADVQNGIYVDGDLVELDGLVVTSGLTADEAGFFVQDAGGGEYSGLYIYLYSYVEVDIEPGDVVNLSGLISEYYDFTELTVDDNDGVEIVGSAEVTIDELDASAITDWEPWESGLVALSNQTVASEVSSYGEVDLASGVSIDNLFFDFSTETGATYTRVVGAMSYNFSEFKINPRSESDFEGYIAGAGPETTTIAAVQSGKITEGSSVLLEDVVVTSGFNQNGDGFYVQDAGGGPYSGVYVYVYSSVKAEVAVGDVLTLTGSYSEYYDITEIVISNSEDIQVTGSATPTTTALSSEAGDWEVFEGVLLTLTDVTATTDVDSYGQVETNYGLVIDNGLYDFSADKNQTWSSVTGLLHYYSANETWQLNPRDADDLVGQ